MDLRLARKAQFTLFPCWLTFGLSWDLKSSCTPEPLFKSFFSGPDVFFSKFLKSNWREGVERDRESEAGRKEGKERGERDEREGKRGREGEGKEKCLSINVM